MVVISVKDFQHTVQIMVVNFLCVLQIGFCMFLSPLRKLCESGF